MEDTFLREQVPGIIEAKKKQVEPYMDNGGYGLCVSLL